MWVYVMAIPAGVVKNFNVGYISDMCKYMTFNISLEAEMVKILLTHKIENFYLHYTKILLWTIFIEKVWEILLQD